MRVGVVGAGPSLDVKSARGFAVNMSLVGFVRATSSESVLETGIVLVAGSLSEATWYSSERSVLRSLRSIGNGFTSSIYAWKKRGTASGPGSDCS